MLDASFPHHSGTSFRAGNPLIGFVSCFIPSLDTAGTQQEVAEHHEGPCGPAAQQCPLERGQASPPSFLIPHARPGCLVGFMAAMVPSLRAPSLTHSVDIRAARLVQAGSDRLDLTPQPGCPDWASGCCDPHSADMPSEGCLFIMIRTVLETRALCCHAGVQDHKRDCLSGQTTYL